MKRLAWSITFALGAAACLEPVEELAWDDLSDAGLDAGLDTGLDTGLDAGHDGGPGASLDGGPQPGLDAGLDAGRDAGRPDGGGDAIRACQTYRDCPSVDAGFAPFCTQLTRSCLNGRCVQECSSTPRTCEITDGGPCLKCSEPAMGSCSTCFRSRVCTMRISSQACPGAFSVNGAFQVGSSNASCGGPISPLDGGMAVGQWYDLPAGDALLWIPALGGWCTASQLPTSAPRMSVQCPVCTFVEMGCQ